MTVFVDNERITWRGKLWCHLVADSLDELHAFAAVLGLKRGWFQEKASYPHYDVTTEVRDRALRLGAYFSDRGRPFQADRGRQNGVAVSSAGEARRNWFECI